MPGFVWTDLIPTFISAGAGLAGGVLRSDAAGRAADTVAAGGERAAEIQAASAAEQLELLRQIYNQDIRLSRPSFAVGQRALQSVSRSLGQGLPSKTFTEAPAEIGPFTRPGSSSSGSPDSALPNGPGVAPNTPGGVASGALSGFGVGTTIAPFTGPAAPFVLAGSAIAGAASGLFGRGREEADQIVPSQNRVTSEFRRILDDLKAKDAAGTISQDDFQIAHDGIAKVRDDFFTFTQDFGRAGPGARDSIGGLADNILGGLIRDGKLPGRKHGGPVYARRNGGFTAPRQRYLVGEEGVELFDAGAPGPPFQRVGQNGPEIFIPPEDGNIIPNDQTMKIIGRGSTAGAGFRRPGLIPRAAGGPVNGSLRPRSSGPPVPPGNVQTGGFPVQPTHFLGPRSSGAPIPPGNVQTGGLRPSTSSEQRTVFRPAGATGITDGGSFAPRTGAPALGTVAPAGAVSTQVAPTFGDTSTRTLRGGANEGFRNTTFTDLGNDIPTIDTPTNRPFGDWSFDNSQGIWWNAKQGLIYNPKTDLLSDPNDPDRGEFSRFEPGVGEELQPFGEEFSFNPEDHGFDAFNTPFEFDDAGFQPFNEQFEFDPESGGFQPFNEEFSFTGEDLENEPGFQFGRDQGEQAIRRNLNAIGVLGATGRTGKELIRFANDFATTKFGEARNRARSDFDLRRSQSQNAYRRAVGEFEQASGQTQGEYIRQQMSFGISQQQATEAYNRALDDFNRRRTNFNQDRDRRFDIMTAIAGGG